MLAYLQTFLLTCSATLLLFVGLGLYQGPLEGDLTRLGFFSEREFQVVAARPSSRVRDPGVPQNPVVAVLGDSFSEHESWQQFSEPLVGKGVFLTTHWLSMLHHECVMDWILATRRKHPGVKVVLLAAVERFFVERFSSLNLACGSGGGDMRAHAVSTLQPVGASWSLDKLLPDPIYSLRALANSFTDIKTLTISGNVGAVPLLRSDLFSNARPGVLLYFRGDEVKAGWTEQAVRQAASNLKALQEAAARQGLHVIVSVIPDKSTAYRLYLRQPIFERQPPDVWAALDDAGVRQFDIRVPMSGLLASKPDVYRANDTHFGAAGYAFYGQAWAEYLHSNPALFKD